MPGFISLALIYTIIKVVGGASTFFGLLFGVFKVISWIKTKFTSIDNNVVELKNSMDTHITGLRDEIKHQTQALTSELKEQRQDFRTFYAPTLLQMMATKTPEPLPIRAKRTRKNTK